MISKLGKNVDVGKGGVIASWPSQPCSQQPVATQASTIGTESAFSVAFRYSKR